MTYNFFEHDRFGSLILSNEYEPENQKLNHDLLANKYNHKVSQFYNQPCPKYDKYSQVITLGSPKNVLDSYSIGHHDFIYDDPLGTYHLYDICFP